VLQLPGDALQLGGRQVARSSEEVRVFRVVPTRHVVLLFEPFDDASIRPMSEPTTAASRIFPGMESGS